MPQISLIMCINYIYFHIPVHKLYILSHAFSKFCKNRYDFPGPNPQEQIFCKIASSDTFGATLYERVLMFVFLAGFEVFICVWRVTF